jgi:hypothetical protein
MHPSERVTLQTFLSAAQIQARVAAVGEQIISNSR